MLATLRTMRRCCCVLALASVPLLLSCGKSTDPVDDGDVTVSYSPTAATISLVAGGSMTFSAEVTGASSPAIAWSLDGAAAGTGPTYAYAAAAIGVDTVAVSVSAGDYVGGRSWVVTVEEDISQLPPAVTGIALEDGPEPAEVEVTWFRASATNLPIVDYLLACSYAGPVTVDNWNDALQLGSIPHDPDLVQHRALFGPADGMEAGRQAWFAVRARDTAGQLSPISGYYPHVISYAWSLHLRITDDTGAALRNIIVRYNGEQGVTSNADGVAVIGPLRSVDAVTYRTVSEHFDFADGPVGATADTVPVVLLRTYAPDHEVCENYDPSGFLTFVRKITRTDGVADRPTVLLKWESYPLSVWIQPGISPVLGWDLDALAADGVALWNEALGQQYLTSAADSLSADVVVRFNDLPDLLNGQASLIDPAEPVGLAIPRKMLVEVRSTLDTNPGGTVEPYPEMITEVTVHELGHVLGFWGHVCTPGAGNLMDYGGAIGSLDGGPSLLFHEDELRLVHAVRNLPQGVDMSAYDSR
jgi:hypothetical protein